MDELDYKNWKVILTNGCSMTFQDCHMVKQFRTYCFSSRDGLMFRTIPSQDVAEVKEIQL